MTDGGDTVPELSFGFVHVITKAKILYLSLDLWPGPYQSVPEARQDQEEA